MCTRNNNLYKKNLMRNIILKNPHSFDTLNIIKERSKWSILINTPRSLIYTREVIISIWHEHHITFSSSSSTHISFEYNKKT